MKKILSTLLLASALCSLLALASSSSAQSRLAPAGQTAQFQLADDPPLPLPPPPGGDDNSKERFA